MPVWPTAFFAAMMAPIDKFSVGPRGGKKRDKKKSKAAKQARKRNR